jgi:hypothetical protein
MLIQPENVTDFINDTLQDLGKPMFTDISSNLQNHYAMSNLLTQNRVVLESGSGIRFNVLVSQSNSARNVSLGQSDKVNAVNGMVIGSANWRGSMTSYMIFAELVSMNGEPSQIVDYIKQQRIMGMISLAELMENNWWSAPSATDDLTPLGLPYWVTKNATAGLNGGTLSGFSNVAGLSTSTYPNWQNYTFPFTNITRDDFIRGVRQACTKSQWMPVVSGIPAPNTGDVWGFYCNYATRQPLEEALESQNQNLGMDIASMDGKVLLRNTPVNYVSWLDRDTTNPFYGINWGWFKTYILRDWWLRETNIPFTPGQHTVASHFIDLRYQFICKNRRMCFVGSNGTTYPS